MEFKGTKGTFLDGETGWKVKTNDKHWNNPEIQNHEIIDLIVLLISWI